MTRSSHVAKAASIGALASVTCLLLVGSASAATITPTTFADEFNTNAAACSLREAVEAADTNAAFGGCPAGSGADSVPLATGTYQISLPGNENNNVNGSIDISSPDGITISHAGLGAAIIDGGNLDRTISIIDNTGNATITGVTIRGGNQGGSGGALFSNGTLNLANSTLTGSTASNGAGLSVFAGTTTVTNVTISGNRSRDGGGGVEVFDFAGTGLTTGSFNNVTISNNTADSEANGTGNGGGFIRGNGTAIVNLTNTLIAGNLDSGGQAPDCSVIGVPAFPSQGNNNLIGSVTGCAYSGKTGDKLNTNPLLGALADNGGSTFTHALSKGSPAIDGAGAGAATTDQRGVPRSSDIGAYEFATCGKVVVNRVGTSGKDKLTGTAGPDGILGLSGKDTLKGLKGKDGLCGGNGKDKLKGGGSKDKLIGGKGADKLLGGGGNDVCKGGKGKDSLSSC